MSRVEDKAPWSFSLHLRQRRLLENGSSANDSDRFSWSCCLFLFLLLLDEKLTFLRAILENKAPIRFSYLIHSYILFDPISSTFRELKMRNLRLEKTIK